MKTEEIELIRDTYIANLKLNQKWYGIDDHDLGIAIKFVESYAHYLIYVYTKVLKKELEK